MLQLILLSLTVGWLSWILASPLWSGLASIPGPVLRQFTDVFQLLDAFRGRTISSLQRLHAQYGDFVQVGPNTVSISNPDMIASVYGIRANLPKSSHWNVWENQLNGKLVPSILYTLETKPHSVLKRPIAGIFSMSNITRFEASIDSTIISFVKKLDERFISGADSSSREQAVPMHSWAHYFGYDSIMKMTLSRDFGFIKDGGDTEGIFLGMDVALLYRAMVFTMPWLHSVVLNSPIKQFFMRRMAKFQQRTRALIQGRMQEEEQGTGGQDMLQQLLETQQAHSNVVTDMVLNGYVVLPLVAGADTVAIVMTTAVYHLSQHPDIVTNLRNELRTHGVTLPPKYVDLQSLPYLGAVIREALRIHPISAFLSRRTVTSQSGLALPDGRVLPRGTVVAISPWTVHFDESVFGKDANEFSPGRWLQGEHETDSQYDERTRAMRRADLSWGHGDRSCIGKNIALCELYKLVATLYLLFDIELVDPTKQWRVDETLLTKQTGVDVYLKWAEGASLSMLARPGGENDSSDTGIAE